MRLVLLLVNPGISAVFEFDPKVTWILVKGGFFFFRDAHSHVNNSVGGSFYLLSVCVSVCVCIPERLAGL